ncbi:uncharacterized protein [Dermacentor andersoni]|uniref:uncharacterized protein n=1 Tax=Dermacentor andersoni TaxID=34620 RepID=UPI003B3A4E3C
MAAEAMSRHSDCCSPHKSGADKTVRTLIRLHDALVTSRIMYQLPLISPSISQLERLEILHRKGLRRALGVPQTAPNNAVLYIFTDGSVDKVKGSSVAAFHIPSLKYDC